MTSTSTIWYRRESKQTSGLWTISAYQSDDHADGEKVDASAPAPTIPWVWRAREPGRGLLAVDLAPTLQQQAPPLWYVNVDEPTANPAATNLVAFPTDHFAPGTIVSRYTFASMGVNNNQQAGAVRWYRTGIVHQIFVAQEWRRKFVASTLLYVASAFHQANDWSGHLRSDGRRTDLGTMFAAGTRYPQRFAPLEETMPPMDPEG